MEWKVHCSTYRGRCDARELKDGVEGTLLDL